MGSNADVLTKRLRRFKRETILLWLLFSKAAYEVVHYFPYGTLGGIEWLDIHFFEQYGINGADILGKCWMDTVDGFLQNHSINWSDTSDTGDALIVKNVQQWALIGDPSLKIGGYL